MHVKPPKIHVTGSKPPCRVVEHVHEVYRIVLELKVVSHGWCGVVNRVKIAATMHLRDGNVTSYILNITKLKGMSSSRSLTRQRSQGRDLRG